MDSRYGSVLGNQNRRKGPARDFFQTVGRASTLPRSLCVPIEDGPASNDDDCSRKDYCLNREEIRGHLFAGSKCHRHELRAAIVEVLHLIRKLRWMGMEEEAEQLQMKLCDATPIGSVITTARETDWFVKSLVS